MIITLGTWDLKKASAGRTFYKVSGNICDAMLNKRSAGRRRRVSLPVLLCLYIAVPACLLLLQGCSKAPDILSQEPVIPLTESPEDISAMAAGKGDAAAVGPYPELHVEGSINDDLNAASGNGNDAGDASHALSGSGDGVEDASYSPHSSAGNGDDAVNGNGAGNRDNAGNSYLVEGVQLTEKQLEKMSAYFNLKDVNPYLQQVYLIPEDFDPDAENDPVNITCVAGSYDSNRLYSIFYKKGDDSALWNVILRRIDSTGSVSDNDSGDAGTGLQGDGKYRFHSNQMLDPNREGKKQPTSP